MRKTNSNMSISDPINQASRVIQVFTASWNVGNEPPTNMNMLLPGLDSEKPNFYDLIVIGLQESTYAMSQSEIEESERIKLPDDQIYCRFNHDKKKESKFAKFVESAIEPCFIHMTKIILSVLGNEYEVIEHNRRAQMQLFVISKKSLIPFISQVEKNAENTGFMHIFPNKGGLMVTLNIDGTSLGFVSCHLTAHEGVAKCQLRNESIDEILGGARPRDRRYDIFSQCHHIFWMGDMNYRLTFSKDVPKQDERIHRHREPQPMPKQSSGIRPEMAAFRDHKNNKSANKENKSDTSTPPQSPRSEGKALQPVDKVEEYDDDDDEDFDVVDPVSGMSKKNKYALRMAEMNKIFKLITDENWSELMKLDELNRELAAGRVLFGFKALQPSWPPTFKRTRHIGIQKLNTSSSKNWDITYHNCLYIGKNEGSIRLSAGRMIEGVNSSAIENLASENGETQHRNSLTEGNISVDLQLNSSLNTSDIVPSSITNFYNKKRLPSYCDRILYRSWNNFGNNLENISFESVEEVLSSDHKPVRAAFVLKTTPGLKGINVYYEDKKKRAAQRSSTKVPIGREIPGSRAFRSQYRMIGNPDVFNLVSSSSTYPSIESNIESYHTKVYTKIQFDFENIHGINLAEMDSQIGGGKSDPYIVLSTDPPVLGYDADHVGPMAMSSMMSCALFSCVTPHEVKSSVVKHNINPQWHNEKLSIVVLSHDIQGLIENFNFVLAVWDYDTFTKDDVIGTCVISFKEIYEGYKNTNSLNHKFEKYITLNGINTGRIKGRIIVPNCTFGEFEASGDEVAKRIAMETDSFTVGQFGRQASRVSSDPYVKPAATEGGCSVM